jgi:hypothetical protein
VASQTIGDALLPSSQHDELGVPKAPVQADVRLDKERRGVGRCRREQRLELFAPPTQLGLRVLRQRVEVETVQAVEQLRALACSSAYMATE